MTEQQILERAASLIALKEVVDRLAREADFELRKLCRSYDATVGTRCVQPHHLRRACQARGLL